MEGDQRRGAGGVDRHRRPFETEGVGDPPGGDTDGAAGEQVAAQPVVALVQTRPVLLGHGAHEHTGVTAAQPLRVDPGAFERLPGDLEQDALLGVHGRGFAGADPEEFGVELGGLVEETTVPGVGLAPDAGLGIVQGVQVPAPVLGEGADRVRAFVDEPPQGFGGVRPAGEAAGHADDRDGVIVVRRCPQRRRRGRGRGRQRGVAQREFTQQLGQS